MTSVTLNELLQLAGAIADVDPAEKYIDNGGTRTMRIRQYQAIAARFESRRATYVDCLLANCQDRSQAATNVARQLDGLARTSDASAAHAVEYCREHLLPYVQRQAGMPPAIRASIKALDNAFLAFAFVAVFGIPIYALLSYLYRLIQFH